MCMQSFLCDRKLLFLLHKNALRGCAPRGEVNNALRKTNKRELEIPGGYFGRNVVIYVRMRTK